MGPVGRWVTLLSADMGVLLLQGFRARDKLAGPLHIYPLHRWREPRRFAPGLSFVEPSTARSAPSCTCAPQGRAETAAQDSPFSHPAAPDEAKEKI